MTAGHGIPFTEVISMANQQAAAVVVEERPAPRTTLRVRRKFSPPRKSMDVVRNLLRAHQATA